MIADRMGRPPIGPTIQVRLPRELLAEVDALARRAGASRAEMIRELVRDALDNRAELKA